MNRPGTQRLLLIVVLLVVLVLAGAQWWNDRSPGDGNRSATAPAVSVTPVTRRTASPRTSAPAASGLSACPALPREVADAVAAVRNDGPYLRPRDDGGVFGNRERLLPAKPNGYYREYTVRSPRDRFPGPRRLITGGQARLGAEPASWFYTADHYESFCELRPAG